MGVVVSLIKSWQRSGLTTIVCLLVLTTTQTTEAQNNQVAEYIVLPTREIPRYIPNTTKEYNSWSLFLVCSPEWIYYNDEQATMRLQEKFEAFGKAIGESNLAVWFAGEDAVDDDTAFLESDYNACVDYSKHYNLAPGDSPYVIVATEYPDLDQPEPSPNYAVVEIGRRDDKSVIKLLSVLTNQLIAEKIQQKEIDSASYWLAWNSALGNLADLLLSASEHLSFTLRAGIIDVEYKGTLP